MLFGFVNLLNGIEESILISVSLSSFEEKDVICVGKVSGSKSLIVIVSESPHMHNMENHIQRLFQAKG